MHVYSDKAHTLCRLHLSIKFASQINKNEKEYFVSKSIWGGEGKDCPLRVRKGLHPLSKLGEAWQCVGEGATLKIM